MGYLTFGSKFKGICDFYHGINVGAGSPKPLINKVPPLSQMNHSCPVIKAEFYWVFTSVGQVSQGVLSITGASLTENLQISI